MGVSLTANTGHHHSVFLRLSPSSYKTVGLGESAEPVPRAESLLLCNIKDIHPASTAMSAHWMNINWEVSTFQEWRDKWAKAIIRYSRLCQVAIRAWRKLDVDVV